jgi:hypothetical protein
VSRVTAKFDQKDKAQSKSKKKESLVDLPKKLVASEVAAVDVQVKANVVTY